MAVIAHHFLLTLLLRALQQTCAATIDESLLTMNTYIQSLLNAPILLVSVLAKAVTIQLQSYPQVVPSGDVELADEEADIISVILSKLSQDNLKRRYYSTIIFQSLLLLCSHPMNVTQLVSCGVVADLQTLMDTSTEAGEADIIAHIVWKIVSSGEMNAQNNNEVVINSHATQGKFIAMHELART